MLYILGFMLLAVALYWMREVARGEHLIGQLRSQPSYGNLEWAQNLNRGRRLIVAVAGSAGILCVAWAYAPDEMRIIWNILQRLIVAVLNGAN